MQARKNKSKGLAQQTHSHLKKQAEAADAKTADASLLSPKSALDELAEDVALFQYKARIGLSDEMQKQTAKVLDALEKTYAGKFSEASEVLKDIPRSSPYADWKLLVRGLSAFYQDAMEVARENWSRLNPNRRPAKIARTLLLATSNDLIGELAKESTSASQAVKPLSNSEAKLVNYAFRHIHRIDVAIAAKALAAGNGASSEYAFSMTQVRQLGGFIDSFVKRDRDFVREFAHGCIRLSTKNENDRAFEAMSKKIPGPSDDPTWRRLQFSVLTQYPESLLEMEVAMSTYLQEQLPKIDGLSVNLKSAIASTMQLMCAELRIQRGDNRRRGSLTSFFGREDRTVDPNVVATLKSSIREYRSHRSAHKTLVKYLEDIAEIRDEDQQPLSDLAEARRNLIDQFPDEVETALKLLDYYFEQDMLTDADSIVQKLSGQRLESPLAKALPWTIKLRMAMSQSRLKTKLGLASTTLAESQEFWPTWLSGEWYPFLDAAIDLRKGDPNSCTQKIAAAVAQYAITTPLRDVMTLAAMQKMNVPAKELKPYRDAAEQLLKSNTTSMEELLQIGSFFWDLNRVGLQHSGYRNHVNWWSKQFVQQLNAKHPLEPSAHCFDAICLAAKHEFWNPSGREAILPWVEKLAVTEPRVASAWIGVHLAGKGWTYQPSQSALELLASVAKSERDPFYRFEFELRNAEILIRSSSQNRSGRNPDSDEESPCDCPSCRARRLNAGLDEDEYDDEFEDDDYDLDDGFVSEEVERIMDMLSDEDFAAFTKTAMKLKNVEEGEEVLNGYLEKILSILFKYPLSNDEIAACLLPPEAMESVDGELPYEAKRSVLEMIHSQRQQMTESSGLSIPLTAAEKKLDRKQRQRELERKKGKQ